MDFRLFCTLSPQLSHTHTKQPTNTDKHMNWLCISKPNNLSSLFLFQRINSVIFILSPKSCARICPQCFCLISINTGNFVFGSSETSHHRASVCHMQIFIFLWACFRGSDLGQVYHWKGTSERCNCSSGSFQCHLHGHLKSLSNKHLQKFLQLSGCQTKNWNFFLSLF